MPFDYTNVSKNENWCLTDIKRVLSSLKYSTWDVFPLYWLIHSFNNNPSIQAIGFQLGIPQQRWIKEIFPKWLSVWFKEVKTINKKLKPNSFMHCRSTNRIFRKLGGKSNKDLEEVRTICQSIIEIFFLLFVTFESAYKPPKRNKFSLFHSHTYFLPQSWLLIFP